MRSLSWPADHRCKLPAIAAAIAMWLGSAYWPAHALGSCPAINPSAETKFVISRLIAAGLQNADQIRATNYALQAVSNLAATLSRDLSARFVVLSCEQRTPNFDGSDYQPNVVDELSSRNVLVEIWGNLLTSQSGGRTTADGLVGYFVLPMTKSNPPWPQSALAIRDYRAKAVPLKDLFTKMFTQGHHFEVFAAVAFGINETRNNRFDSAQAALCRASLTLEQSSKDQVWTDLKLDPKSLGAGIDTLLKDNLAAARKDPTYQGSLTLPATQSASGRLCPKA